MSVKVALAQFASVDDPQHNVESMAEAIVRAGASGAQIIAFHELSTTNYFCYERRNADRLGLAEQIPGPSTDRLSDVADDHGVHVVLPMYESDGGRRYNTVVLIEPGRGVVESYRKAHIPNIGADGAQEGAEETFYFDPGDTGFRVWRTSLGMNIGILVCFDRHFPEGARLYSEQGADIVFAPTASYRKFIVEELWEAELKTMAFQNAFYVAGINKIGPVVAADESATYPGGSVVFDPAGRLVGRIDHREGLLLADVDPAQAEEAKTRMGYSSARRPDLYGALATS